MGCRPQRCNHAVGVGKDAGRGGAAPHSHQTRVGPFRKEGDPPGNSVAHSGRRTLEDRATAPMAASVCLPRALWAQASDSSRCTGRDERIKALSSLKMDQRRTEPQIQALCSVRMRGEQSPPIRGHRSKGNKGHRKQLP